MIGWKRHGVLHFKRRETKGTGSCAPIPRKWLSMNQFPDAILPNSLLIANRKRFKVATLARWSHYITAPLIDYWSITFKGPPRTRRPSRDIDNNINDTWHATIVKQCRTTVLTFFPISFFLRNSLASNMYGMSYNGFPRFPSLLGPFSWKKTAKNVTVLDTGTKVLEQLSRSNNRATLRWSLGYSKCHSSRWLPCDLILLVWLETCARIGLCHAHKKSLSE